jgi:penicillin-binding protein 1A
VAIGSAAGEQERFGTDVKRALLGLLGLLIGLGIAGLVAGYFVYRHYAAGLPEVSELAVYNPPVVTRVHAGDGRLLAEFATENRVYVPISAIPKVVSNAFISAEDKTFYEHPGIDVPGILHAAITNLGQLGSDRRPIGASTITQQVAKNFLLTNEVSISRKIKEIILALRIEKAYSKDHILELYLNEIYLGYGSYGVAAAALNYFDKSLDELTIAEAAYLAALPKAPSKYNPVTQHQAALDRRNWVIGRMLEDGHITPAEAQEAMAEPLTVRRRGEAETVSADYFAEEVRRELIQRFGDKSLYEGGLSVRTTLDPKLQAIADKTLRDGMQRFDRKYGYRGPVAAIDPGEGWAERLAAVHPPKGLRDWKLAVVLDTDAAAARIGFADGSTGTIPFAELRWARKSLGDNRVGPEVKKPSDAIKPGDVVMVEPVARTADGGAYPADTYALRQIPEIGAAMVAMDPHTGRVLAMVGGWSYQMSEFDRATQALRQPGSSFKPFVYMSALQAGYTPSTIILDAPIVIDQGPGLPLWKPENYGDDFLGPVTMRVGLEKSRNLVTVRLAQAVGMDRVKALVDRFGVIDNMPPLLSMSLGAGETTPLKMATAYSMIVNGGKRIVPRFIDRVQDRSGATIFNSDTRPCPDCRIAWHDGLTPPTIPDEREQVVDPQTAYQMVHLLEGVVQRGTGHVVASVGKPLAGKTGTTNDSRDAWFVGFSPDLTVAVYFGYDQPRSLGKRETGGVVAAPVFRDFMQEALADKPGTPFRIPPGIRLVRVDAQTGQRATSATEKAIYEAFKPGTEPTDRPSSVIEGVGVASDQPDLGLPGQPMQPGQGGSWPPQPGAAQGAGSPGGLY